MGVLNVTPDSFSDGGRWLDHDQAIAHGHHMIRAGADLVDIGGESTRPGAGRVDEVEEARRVLPVVEALVAAGVVVSIDTMRAAIAERAVAAGAALVNDVSGGLADPGMLPLVARARVPVVLMHWRGHSREMQQRAIYDDPVADVVAELRARLHAADLAGVDPALVVLDPGIGFAKSAEHNWEILGRLDELITLGHPVLVGASRKSFLGDLLSDDAGRPRPPEGRDAASAVVSALAALAGAWCVRVHEVAASADAVRVAAAWRARARARARASASAADVNAGASA
jgi:dihydropteroate synthase